MLKAPAADAGLPDHHRRGGGFRNPPGSPSQTARIGDFLRFLLWDMRRARLPALPAAHVAETPLDLAALADNHVAWLGHACFALRLGGKLILTDPFLSANAGPLGLGPRRFLEPAVAAAALPRLDAIVISHNHYDHLDLAALSAYRWRAETPVVCPLGLGPLIRRQGFAVVHERDWWQCETVDGVEITALPAVHFSGRGLFDRNRTLWASFSIASAERKVWFGGDTAPGQVFDQIGHHAGPFDLAMIGIGSYEPRSIMQASHATPEEAVQIARQIRADKTIGMHWGSIMLTPEDPFEAPHRFRRAALEQQYGEHRAWILAVGESRPF